MAFCSNCGANNLDSAFTCARCGAPLQGSQQQAAPYGVPTYQVPVRQPVTPIPTGGIIAWAIITLLLCTIPGVVALIQASGINNSYSPEEQQRKLNSAKTWCIVGTVLGGLFLILYIVGMSAGMMANM